MHKTLYSEATAFIGDLVIGEKGIEVKDIISGTWRGRSYQFMLKTPDGNASFVKVFGNTEIKEREFKFKVDGVENTLKWAERFNEELVKVVPNFMKRTYINGDVKKTFLDDVEWANFLLEELPTLNGKTLKIYKGDITFNPNENGNTYTEVGVSKLVVLSDEDKAHKDNRYGFFGQNEIFFTKDSTDADIWKGSDLNTKYIIEDLQKKVVINGYCEVKNTSKATREAIPEYLAPVTFIIDLTKMDFDKDVHLAKAKALCNMFRVKGKGVYSVGAKTAYVNGKEEKVLTEDEIKELLGKEKCDLLEMFPEMKSELMGAAGIKSVGEKIQEIRIVRPHGKKPLAELVEAIDENMLDLWKIAVAKEKASTGIEAPKQEKKAIEKVVEEEEFEDLFA